MIITESLSQDNRTSARDWEPPAPEKEAGLLTVTPECQRFVISEMSCLWCLFRIGNCSDFDYIW